MRLYVALWLLSTLACAGNSDSDLTSFRNGFGGVFPHATPPLIWGSPKSIVWKYLLSRRSNASPIVVGDRIFVLDEPCRFVCLRAADGKLLWEDDAALESFGSDRVVKDAPRPSWLASYGYTTPTPVSDGKRVWCVFGHGLVVCYDLEGRRLWNASIDVADKVAGLAASPCLADGVLIVSAKRKDRLCGFDPDNGRKLWQLDEGVQDGSCVPFVLNGQVLLAASAGLIVEPRTGRVLQRGLLGKPLDGDLARQPVNWGPTVVIENGLAVFHVHFLPDRVQAALRGVRLGTYQQSWDFVTNDSKALLGRMGNSPVLHQGLLYAVNDGGLLQVFDAASGRQEYSQQLPRQSYASLALAGGHVFAFGLQSATVFKPGRRYEQMAQFKHGFRDFFSSPVFVGRRLYFRDAKAIWCIEQAADFSPSPNPAGEDADAPSLADSAKTAPLIPFQDWLLLDDSSRTRARDFGRAVEWTLTLVALVAAGWLLKRAPLRARLLVSLVPLTVISVALSCWAGADRFGNAYLPVAAWVVLGGVLLSLQGVQSDKRTPVRGRSVGGLWVGAALGAGLGLLVHQLPLLLLTVWHILSGATI